MRTAQNLVAILTPDVIGRTTRLVVASLASSISITSGLEANAQVGTQITVDDMVEVYTLPADLQTVIEGNDGLFYVINYYIYVKPNSDADLPGISNSQWWTTNNISQFFPWGQIQDWQMSCRHNTKILLVKSLTMAT